MRVRVEEREEGTGPVCPLCRAALAGALWTCAACGTALHAECAAELPRCPTLGCAGRPPEGARAPDRGPVPPRRPFVEPGQVVAMGRPPLLSERGRDALRSLAITFVLALLLLPFLLGRPLPTRAPAPAPPPIRLPHEQPPGAVEVLAAVSLAGDPPRQVQLERAWELQLRCGERVWSLEGLGSCTFQGVVPYPGHPQVELLRFDASLGGLSSTRDLGFTRDGRLVVVRATLASSGTRELLLSSSDGVAIQGESARPPADAPARWVELMESSDPLTVLDALGWLALVSSPSPYSLRHQDDATPTTLARARAAPEVRAAVTRLRGSPDPWIREAARHAWLLSGR